MSKIVNFFAETVQTVTISLALMTAVYTFLILPTQVDGKSMEPSLHNGERLLVDKVTYKVSKPVRGDIVVLKSPENSDILLIKRLIGLPGDQVLILNNKVYINNQLLNEDYILDKQSLYSNSLLPKSQNFIIAEDEYLVLGDNRNNSFDSRFFGLIKFENIVGRAAFSFWPPNDLGPLPQPQY